MTNNPDVTLAKKPVVPWVLPTAEEVIATLLDYWRREHWTYFNRECARIGRTPEESMIVICETFDVLREIDI